MTDIAITVENLSKRYRIGLKEQRHETLASALTDVVTAPIRNFRRLRQLTHFQDGEEDVIWALKDVSFEVKRGEVVGIIGRNGAGKSTLLKILAGITEPTSGRAIIRGRVGSLLEVGTGMHPELTGRENIYLAGTILGMKKAEIDRKFEEIVEFAEIGKFIDTPIKRYSSGMKVRLGFAIAAHLEPEILLVDEVLAVGDAAFQKKCLGKMDDVAREGRTVLFVSHNMGAIRRLCNRAVWIHNGSIQKVGDTHTVIGNYESYMLHQRKSTGRLSHRDNGRIAYFFAWRIIEPETQHENILNSLGPVRIEFLVNVNERVTVRLHSIALFDNENRLIWANAIKNKIVLAPGNYGFIYEFPSLPIVPGNYRWIAFIYDDYGLADRWDAVPDLIVTTPIKDNLPDKWIGILNIDYRFDIVANSNERNAP